MSNYIRKIGARTIRKITWITLGVLALHVSTIPFLTSVFEYRILNVELLAVSNIMAAFLGWLAYETYKGRM